MALEQLLALILLGIVHWVLVIILLQDLAGRSRVLGGRKTPWAVVIILVTFVGPLAYLLCHPQIFYEKKQ